MFNMSGNWWICLWSDEFTLDLHSIHIQITFNYNCWMCLLSVVCVWEVLDMCRKCWKCLQPVECVSELLNVFKTWWMWLIYMICIEFTFKLHSILSVECDCEVLNVILKYWMHLCNVECAFGFCLYLWWVECVLLVLNVSWKDLMCLWGVQYVWKLMNVSPKW